MADLSITAANVIAGSDAAIVNGRAGATVTAGQVVYREASTGKYKLAYNDSATAEVKVPAGIALHGAADGQPLAVQTGGDITIGATLTPGSAYVLSSTPGAIAPVADLGTGDYVVQLGLAKTAAVLALRITIPGVTL
ncbi:hypothetical protein [Rhodoplanes serenus]|uniref:hypothetical protein n=1 Tax=Rhodoplanes serenus TaxID=200615 RepID=UPI000DAE27CB|nr:hypothetical protein [Rhodoplanes serenus]RAI34526.1 hypothetical protein CH340_08850 [Rhodoplanes serenus]